MQRTRKQFLRHASVWSIIAIACSVLCSGCAKPAFDIDDEGSRLTAIQDIRNALTKNECGYAIDLATKLFISKYSNNEIRLLYASAHGCNAGIQFYTLIDLLIAADVSTLDNIFKNLVRFFPSRISLDSRYQSGQLAQDGLQAMLKPGAVVGVADSVFGTTNNPGSLLTRDRTDDSNAYMMFVAMAEAGAAMNRYGYTATSDPIAMNYSQGVDLPWITNSLVSRDVAGSGCALASAYLNMIDSMNKVVATLPGNAAANVTSMLTILDAAITVSGTVACTNDGYTAIACSEAMSRLRYRRACYELAPAASAAAGIIVEINSEWL